MARCNVCFRHCDLKEGQVGPCGARTGAAGAVKPLWYGKISSLALDPIEKKPLARFRPGSLVLSAGGLGCNLRCPFCQNHEIAQAEDGVFSVPVREVSPEQLAEFLKLVASGKPLTNTHELAVKHNANNNDPDEDEYDESEDTEDEEN